MKATRQQGELALKIARGLKLTPTEHEIARFGGLVSGSYVDHSALHYEDNERQGFLCLEHPAGIIKLNPDGSRTFCGWGVHFDQCKAEYLTPGNRRLLAKHGLIQGRKL